MSDRLVLDASAALAFLRDEVNGADVAGLLARRLGAGVTVVVPELFWLEIVNVLARRHALPMEQVLAGIRHLDSFGIETVAGDRSLTLLGLDLVITHRLSAYDAAYLALAVAEDCSLLTTDTRLGQVAGDRSLIPFPRAIHETRAPYESSTPMKVWARQGAYLAELRRQAEAGVLP